MCVCVFVCFVCVCAVNQAIWVAGNNSMVAVVFESGWVSISLQTGGRWIACGSSLTAGDTGVTFAVSGQGSQYVVEAIANTGTGSWGIQRGTSSQGQVRVSPDYMYTVIPG